MSADKILANLLRIAAMEAAAASESVLCPHCHATMPWYWISQNLCPFCENYIEHPSHMQKSLDGMADSLRSDPNIDPIFAQLAADILKGMNDGGAK